MKDAEAALRKAAADGGMDSATLAVRDAKSRYRGAFGNSSDVDDVFLIASITKPMTAAGVMLLADRGELSLSDPAMKFLPEFSEGDRKQITIQHLLTHTSGLPDQLPHNSDLRKAHAPLSEFVAGAVKTPLLFTPGEKYSYQSMGILLAAEIAERITAEPFRDFLKRELFQPLGMTRTELGLGDFTVADTVRSQVEFAAPEAGSGKPEARDWDWNSPYWRDLGSPWGGAHSTATDIELFLRSFLGSDHPVLKPATARSMIRNHTPGMSAARGLGFQLGADFGEDCSERTFGHGGSTGTRSWADPERGLSFVLLTSLPARMSGKTILDPVSNLVSLAG